MEHTKTSIKKELTEGKLETAAKAALAYAEYCGLEDIANKLTVLNSQIQSHQETWNAGLINYETFSLNHAQIAHGLTQWVSRLPDEPKQNTAKKKLLDEATFKKRIFYLICSIKILVIFRLVYHWSTGGFTNDQFQGTAALLAPALAAYISVMLADYLRQHHSDISYPKYISGPLVTFSYWLFLIYFISLLLFIEMKVSGRLSFTQMNFWLALVESVLGGYIGQIVFSFFKKEG